MIQVATDCTVVPDGVEQDARQPQALRFSILLTPAFASDLARWPQAITALLAGNGAVRIHLNYLNKPGVRTFDARISRHDARTFAAQGVLAQRTWQRAFPEGDSALEALRAVLQEESGARAARAARPADTKAAGERVYRYSGMDLSPEKCTAPDTRVLGQFLHALHLREFAQTLAATDNKSVGIRDARESSFALGQVLDNKRQSAVDAEVRKSALNAAADEMETKLDGFYEATTLLRSGKVAALSGDSEPPVSTVREGLSNLDKLLQDDWLQKTSVEVETPLVLHECATAYERTVPLPEAEEQAKETARRRFTGLRMQPTLAKLVRLLIDVEVVIDKDTLPFDTSTPLDEFGDVAVEIIADRTAKTSVPATAQLQSTRFRLHGTLGSTKSPLSFAPASRYEWPHPGGGSRSRFLPLIDGFLHLRTQPGRYYLRTFDVALGLNAIAAAANERNAGKARGAESVSDRMAPLRSQGFELGDTKNGVEIASDMLKALALSGLNEPLYAEDLLMGFRVDIQRTAAGVKHPGPWHTATARSLTFQDIPIEGASHLFPAYEERDDGFVAPMSRHSKEEDGVWTFPRQELFSWSGEPLALPAARGLDAETEDMCPSPPPKERGFPIACLAPEADLNIGVTYDFGPKGRDATKRRDVIPALRLGDGYRFVLRACYGNGGGPRFDPSQYRDLYAASALGATGLEAAIPKAVALDEAPAPFTTPDPVTAPNLALFVNDPLVLATSTENDRPAEKYDQVVLRAEYRPDRVARRLLLPPRVTFEQAEIQKQFDHIDEPRGALIEMSLDPQNGTLPQAVGGETMLGGTPGAHRGAVYKLVKQSVRPQHRPHPFFCDARGRCVVLALQRPGTTPDTGGEDVSPPLDDLRFWAHGQGPDDALPIVVEFRIAPLGVSGARFVGRPEVRSYPSTGPTRARRVVVEVGLAEKIELRTWCVDENLMRNNLFMGTLTNLKKNDHTLTSAKVMGPFVAIEQASRSGDGDGKHLVQAILQAYGSRAPSTFSDALTWSVVAATRRPLAAPSFVLKNGQPVLTVRRLRAVKAEERWAASPRPEDEPEGTQVFLDGKVEVHRRSAGELRVQLLWKDFNDQVAVERVGDRWESIPRWHRLEKTLAVALSEDIANDSVALDEAAAAQSKRLAFELGWQAVRIGVRLVSRTRFAHCYAPVETVSEDDLSPFERENHLVGDFLLPGGAEDAERSIWLKATQRPAKPEVTAVELVRHFRELARSATSVVAESHWTLRIRLPRGSWHQSGEGELLALVLMPKDAVSSTRTGKASQHHRLDEKEFTLSDSLRRLDLFLGLRFADPEQATLPKLMQLVTGWAVDPATDAGRLQPILSPGQFAGWVEKRSDLTLPFAVPQDGTQDKEELAEKVSIIAYEPVLDAATGDRYVDVDFLSPDIDSPFVRLSVARYQPRALDDLWLSSQVCLDPAVVPSRRQVELRWQSPSVLQVKISGPAYKRRTLGAVEGPASEAEKKLLASEAHKTDVPWMRISIQRLDRDGSGFLAADGAAYGLQREIAALAVSEQGLWETEFELPPTATRWRVFIEEVEFYLPGAGVSQRETLETMPRGFKCELDVDAPKRPNLGVPAPSASAKPPRTAPK